MNITHDKESGALYIRLREGRYDHTEDFSRLADVYLDVDAEGNVLGLEALSFEDLAQAIGERGGKLELPEHLHPATYEDALRGAFEQSYGGASGSVGKVADEASEVTGQVADQANEAVGGDARPDEPDPEEVREAMASLGPDDRAALELLIGEGLNIVDFAERLGVSVAEAQVTRRAAFEKLNEALRRRGPTTGRAVPHRPAAG